MLSDQQFLPSFLVLFTKIDVSLEARELRISHNQALFKSDKEHCLGPSLGHLGIKLIVAKYCCPHNCIIPSDLYNNHQSLQKSLMTTLPIKKRKYSDIIHQKLLYSFSEMQKDHKTMSLVSRELKKPRLNQKQEQAKQSKIWDNQQLQETVQGKGQICGQSLYSIDFATMASIYQQDQKLDLGSFQ